MERLYFGAGNATWISGQGVLRDGDDKFWIGRGACRIEVGHDGDGLEVLLGVVLYVDRMGEAVFLEGDAEGRSWLRITAEQGLTGRGIGVKVIVADGSMYGCEILFL